MTSPTERTGHRCPTCSQPMPERDQLVLDLLGGGHTLAEISTATKLSERQITRIVGRYVRRGRGRPKKAAAV